MSKDRIKGVTEIIEDVKADICNNYCKWPDIWDEEKEGCELSESDHCRNCPLNRLRGGEHDGTDGTDARGNER